MFIAAIDATKFDRIHCGEGHLIQRALIIVCIATPPAHVFAANTMVTCPG